MICTNCGKENPDNNKFCLQCGRPLAGGAARPTATQTSPRRSLGRLPLLIGGVVALVALAAAAWFLLPRLTGGGGGREMLLAAPNRDGEVDLSVLRLGDDLTKAIVVAENVTTTSSTLFDYARPGEPARLTSDGIYGNFLPDDKRLVFFYSKDGKTELMEYALGAEAPTEIISDENAQYFAGPMPNSRDLFITEYGSSDTRCYVAAPGDKAERVARADRCGLIPERTRLLTTDYNSKNELTLTVADPDGTNETTLLDDVATDYANTSADASHIAYLNSTDDGQSAVLLDAAGQTLFESDTFSAFNGYGFAGASDTFYFVGANEDGEWELYTSAGGGPLIAARALHVQSAGKEPMLAVLTADEDHAGEVTVFNLAAGTSAKVASGDNLMIAQIADPPRLLIREETDGDLKLTAAEWSGANPVTLFDDSDRLLGNLQILPGDKRVLLSLYSEGLFSLYVAPLDGAPGYFILEDWAEFDLLDQSSDTLLLAGREDEGDDPILYAVTLAPEAKLIELDDSANSYPYAVVAPDGRSALYNAIMGDRLDDVVVRQAKLDGEERPVDLYEEQMLVAARWKPLRFTDVSWRDPGALAQPAAVGIAGTEAGLIVAYEVYDGRIDQQALFDLGGNIGEGNGRLYYFDGFQGQDVQFDIYGGDSINNSSLDPAAGLLDESLNLLADNDDGGSGSDSRLTYTLPHDGRYYLVIVNSGGGYDDNFTYQVSMSYP